MLASFGEGACMYVTCSGAAAAGMGIAASLLLVVPAAAAPLRVEGPAGQSSPAVARSCMTPKKTIVKQLRHENAYPVVQGMRLKDVTACRGRWAVINRASLGDVSFNASYRHGRWHYHSGYPMASCRHIPTWLCPNHP